MGLDPHPCHTYGQGHPGRAVPQVTPHYSMVLGCHSFCRDFTALLTSCHFSGTELRDTGREDVGPECGVCPPSWLGSLVRTLNASVGVQASGIPASISRMPSWLEAAPGGSGAVPHLSGHQGVPVSPRQCLAPGAQQRLLPCATHPGLGDPGGIWGILEPPLWTVCLETLGGEKSL